MTASNPLRRRVLAFATIGVIVAASLIGFRDPRLPLESALLAVILCGVGLVPAAIRLVTPVDDRAPFPFMELCAAIYAGFFGLTVFVAHGLTRMDPDATAYIAIYRNRLEGVNVEAQILALAGLVAMLSSWWLARGKLLPRRVVFRLPGPASADRAVYLSWALLIGAVVYKSVPPLQALPSIGQFLGPAGFMGIAVFLVYFHREETRRWQQVVFFACLFPAWVGLTAKLGYLSPLIFVGIIWWGVAPRLRGKSIFVFGAFAILMAAAYPGVQTIRAKVWESVESGQSPPAAASPKAPSASAGDGRPLLDLPYAVGIDIYRAHHDRFNQVWGLLQRVSYTLILSVVVEKSPKQVPYWGGRTYRTLLVGWIPRIFWKDKPREVYGNEFGRRYGMVAEGNRHMSLNIPWVVEAYTNFGRWGVIIGMGLMGIFLGALDRFLNRPGARPLEFAIGTAILTPLVFLDSNFTLMTGSLIPLVICAWVFFLLGLRWPSVEGAEDSRDGRP